MSEQTRILHQVFCPHCLVQCVAFPVSPSNRAGRVYYGCRICGQYRDLLKVSGDVIAVLDSNMEIKQSWKDRRLYVNWLMHRRLFDFDTVHIIEATDEDIERFCVQVGNDTDLMRRGRYKYMPCLVAIDYELSKPARRFLSQLFGQVKKFAN